jgi:hypothetical protein
MNCNQVSNGISQLSKRSFPLFEDQSFILFEDSEEIASYLRTYLRNVNSHCFDDSQWRSGWF